MPDLFKVKRNVAKMVSMNAPESDIDTYISQEGTTVDAIRGIKLDTQEESPGIISTILDTSPKQLAEKGNWVQSGLLKTGEDIYKEGIAPIVHGASTLAFGAPKAIAESTGTKDLIYPEQKTFTGKALRFGSEAGGLLGGGAIKLATKLGTRVLPKLATEGILRKAGRMALEGGTAGLLQAPEGSLGKGMAKRPEQAATWAALSGAMPFAGKALGKSGEILAKSGRWLAKEVGGITDSTVATIKRLGADRVFDPLKAKADYIVQDLTPRLYQSFQDSVKNFTPEIQNFAEKKLNIPKQTIDSVKNKGIYAVNKVRQLYNDSTDAIYQKIEKGFTDKRLWADKAYQTAFDLAPQGKQINIRPAIEQAGSRLKRLGLISEGGSLTELGNNEISKDSVYGKLLDFYKSADAISGVEGLQGKTLTQGQILKASKAAKETLVNKDQYTFLRDKLNALYKNKPSDVDVSKVVNQFYADGETSGIKGLQQARDLQRKAFQAEDSLYNKGLIKEGKLDNFQKLSEAEKRQLKQIEEYTGQSFVDDLDSITASRSLDKLSEFEPKKMAQDMINAKNPKWTKSIKAEYEDILGKEKFKTIYDDLMAHFANIDFELISETPGTGGGIYPSKAGLIRKGIAGTSKQYYRKNIPKKIQDIRKFSGRLRSNFPIQ